MSDHEQVTWADDLMREIEEKLDREGLLPKEPSDDDEPPEPPRRTVQLGHFHHALFEGHPRNELWVYKIDLNAPIQLAYFDPEGLTDAEAIKRVRTRLTFS